MGNDEMFSWRELIIDALADRGETWSDVVAHTLSDAELDRQFDCGFGGTEGVPFTLWTAQRVYFPWTYDGAEGVASAPRNPCDEATRHVGA